MKRTALMLLPVLLATSISSTTDAQSSPASQERVWVVCDPAPCLEPNALPTFTQWVTGVNRLHPNISKTQAAQIWHHPDKWWRNHIAWQRRITNWSVRNPAASPAAGGYCRVTTRNSTRNIYGERVVAVTLWAEWHGDDTWDVEVVGYHTTPWISPEIGGAYTFEGWTVVEDWWSTKGGSGSRHAFRGWRRWGLFTSFTIPILGIQAKTNQAVYMGAYFDRTVETGNNDRQSCYTID